MGLLDLPGHWGVSDGEGVQEQPVKKTIKKLSSQPKSMATQDPGLYNELRGEIGRGLEFPAIGKNLFIDLAEKIARELNASNCWVCGGAFMRQEWPWKGSSLNAYQLLLRNHSITIKESDRPQSWILTSEVIWEESLGPYMINGWERSLVNWYCLTMRQI
jgi:hypothetical protein